MAGIRKHIPESKVYRRKVTLEDFNNACKIINKESYQQPTLLMGLTSMILFRFMEELYSHGINLKYHIVNFKRCKTIYLSLNEKHGLYKLIIHPNKQFKYSLYKGTFKIGDYNNVTSLYDKIK